MIRNEILKKIIIEREITVSIDNLNVLSFYLIHPCLDIGNIKQRKKIILTLIKENRIPKGE